MPKKPMKAKATPASPDAVALARLKALAQTEAPPTMEAAATTKTPEAREPGPRSPIVDRNALPIRNETKADEIRKYPLRMAAWERRKAIGLAHKDHEADLSHLRVCIESACPDEAHIAIQRAREWKEATHHDIKHLETCIMLPIGPEPVPIEPIEDCPTLDRSHLLPPKPLAGLVEYCCPLRCYPKGTIGAWSSCLSLPARVRMRRELERSLNPSLAKAFGGVGFVEPLVVQTQHISESTEWGLHHTMHDLASTPLREEE